jgi:hypothetical protein
MEEQADGLVAIIANGAQALGLRMGRVIECGGVLGTEDDGLGLHPLDGGLHVGLENGLGLDGRVVEEAVSGFGLIPRATGLRDGRRRLLGKVGGQGDQAL